LLPYKSPEKSEKLTAHKLISLTFYLPKQSYSLSQCH